MSNQKSAADTAPPQRVLKVVLTNKEIRRVSVPANVSWAEFQSAISGLTPIPLEFRILTLAPAAAATPNSSASASTASLGSISGSSGGTALRNESDLAACFKSIPAPASIKVFVSDTRTVAAAVAPLSPSPSPAPAAAAAAKKDNSSPSKDAVVIPSSAEISWSAATTPAEAALLSQLNALGYSNNVLNRMLLRAYCISPRGVDASVLPSDSISATGAAARSVQLLNSVLDELQSAATTGSAKP